MSVYRGRRRLRELSSDHRERVRKAREVRDRLLKSIDPKDVDTLRALDDQYREVVEGHRDKISFSTIFRVRQRFAAHRFLGR